MKRTILYFFAAVLTLFMLASCAATKRDCNGVKHYKHKNGFYI
jgi:hypothetical protein